MIRDTYEKIKQYCVEEELIRPEDGIVVGLSGGADSLCLLRFLVELREEWKLRLCAVHINHGIRGEAGVEDEQASEKMANDLSVDFRVFHKDIPKLAREQGVSVEEAGRMYRYQCFEEVREELGFDKVAVAHHRDDQAETVLWQMLRGSGICGLGGIRPKRDGIVRPLLALERQEIEDTLQQENMAWCEDASNHEEDYTRNKLRNRVFPYLEEEVQPMARQHLAELAEECQMVWEYLKIQTNECYKRIVWEPDGDETDFKVSVSALEDEDPVIQRQLILAMMEKLAGSRKDLGRAHVEAVMRLAKGETGKKIDLPYGMQAEREYNWLWLRQPDGSKKNGCLDTKLLDVERMTSLGEALHFTDSQGQKYEVVMQRISRDALPAEVPKNHCTKWFDCDRIDANAAEEFAEIPADMNEHIGDKALKWRYPVESDYLSLGDAGGSKKLSRIMIDEKIPTARREQMLVLALGHHVLWIPELGRTSAEYYVTDETKNVLTAQLKRIS